MAGRDRLDGDENESRARIERSPPEQHPLNPAAVRWPGGYWNEDSLPVTDWEVPAERVVLPEHLQHRLGGGVPAVLRWDEEKFNLVMSKHKRDRDVILKLTQRLDGWRYLGKERGSPNLRVLFQDEQERRYSLTVGELQGSYNVVTVFGGSDKRFLDKRLRGIEEVVRSG